MSKTRVFPGVTFALLSRMREEDGDDYALAVDPGRIGGTVHKPTPLGEVVVRFEHDDQRAEMTVTIVSKPALLPAAVLWAGVSHALRRASGGVAGDRR
jgi:hypothetical protein